MYLMLRNKSGVLRQKYYNFTASELIEVMDTSNSYLRMLHAHPLHVKYCSSFSKYVMSRVKP